MKILKLDTLIEIKKAYIETFYSSISPEDMEYIEKRTLKFTNYANVYAIYENKYIGFAAVYMNDNENKIAYISSIGINEQERSKHFGSELIRYCENESKRNGMCKIQLEVKKNNTIANMFYLKNGYSYLKKESENSFFMEKKLT